MTDFIRTSLRLQKTIAAFLLLSLLQACQQQESREDVQQWLHAASLIKPNLVPTAPEIPLLIMPSYTALALEEPFNRVTDTDTSMLDTPIPRPLSTLHQQHAAQTLEEFSLDSIEMVGTISKGQQPHALLKVADHLYTVKPGDYVGKNCGVIRQITEEIVVIEEQEQTLGNKHNQARKNKKRTIIMTKKGVAK